MLLLLLIPQLLHKEQNFIINYIIKVLMSDNKAWSSLKLSNIQRLLQFNYIVLRLNLSFLIRTRIAILLIYYPSIDLITYCNIYFWHRNLIIWADYKIILFKFDVFVSFSTDYQRSTCFVEIATDHIFWDTQWDLCHSYNLLWFWIS